MKLIMEMKRMRERCVSAAGCILSVLAALMSGGCKECDYTTEMDMPEYYKYLFEVENHSNIGIWVSHAGVSFDHVEECKPRYVAPHGRREIKCRLSRDEIFERCDRLQLSFFGAGVDGDIDYGSALGEPREYTRDDFEACDWLIVYER